MIVCAALHFPAMIMSMSSAQIAFVQFLLFGWTSEKYLLCMTSADALWNHKLPKCWAAFCCTSASKFAELSNTELLLYRRIMAVMCIQQVLCFLHCCKDKNQKNKLSTRKTDQMKNKGCLCSLCLRFLQRELQRHSKIFSWNCTAVMLNFISRTGLNRN